MSFYNYKLSLGENLNNAVIALSIMGLIILLVMFGEFIKKKPEEKTDKEKVWLVCGFIIAVAALVVSVVVYFTVISRR